MYWGILILLTFSNAYHQNFQDILHHSQDFYICFKTLAYVPFCIELCIYKKMSLLREWTKQNMDVWLMLLYIMNDLGYIEFYLTPAVVLNGRRSNY